MSPLVSVVTVTLNCRDDIEDTIKSVIKQSYKKIEYLIIDGKSNDGTLNIINKYIKHIDYFVSEKDNGIYDAFNKSIKNSKGDWIIFMNSGDKFVEDDVIEKVFSKKNDCDFIYGNTIVKYFLTGKKKQISSKPISTMWQGMPFCHQSCFIKKKINLIENYNNSNVYTGDYEFILSSFFKKFHFKYLNITVSEVVTNGLTESNRIRTNVSNFFTYMKFEKNFLKILWHLKNILVVLLKEIIKFFIPKKLLEEISVIVNK